jgi:transposase
MAYRATKGSKEYRKDANMAQYGQAQKPKALKPSRKKLSAQDSASIFWFKSLKKGATLAEVLKFVDSVGGPSVSKSTISREYKNLGFTGKVMHHTSANRDEDDRVAYFVNKPSHPVRPGTRSVNYRDVVDIDEAGRYCSDVARDTGHSWSGVRCNEEGPAPRTGNRLSFAAAVDANVGCICCAIYPKGTTNEKFYTWMELNVLPKIVGRKRVIAMDRLNSHLTPQVKSLIERNGHYLVLRPTSSPDLGGVEWVFSYVDEFLKGHDGSIDDKTLQGALQAAFNTVTAHDIAGYMAKAHINVDSHEYEPYEGQQ